MSGAPAFVLIHSPLVGPRTWSFAGDVLKRQGRKVVVPSLLGPGGSPPTGWRDCVASVSDVLHSLSEPVVLVGHSGSGLLLPAISDALAQPVGGLIFVDSGIPARTGETPFVPPALLDELRLLSADGMLPPWSSWFGDEVMRGLVPDEEVRSILVREMPRLPSSFLEQRVPSPAGWDRTPCAYLLLSEAYRDAAAEAKERGWPVETIAGGQHLDLAAAPGSVSDALLRLEAKL